MIRIRTAWGNKLLDDRHGAPGVDRGLGPDEIHKVPTRTTGRGSQDLVDLRRQCGGHLTVVTSQEDGRNGDAGIAEGEPACWVGFRHESDGPPEDLFDAIGRHAFDDRQDRRGGIGDNALESRAFRGPGGIEETIDDPDRLGEGRAGGRLVPVGQAGRQQRPGAGLLARFIQPGDDPSHPLRIGPGHPPAKPQDEPSPQACGDAGGPLLIKELEDTLGLGRMVVRQRCGDRGQAAVGLRTIGIGGVLDER